MSNTNQLPIGHIIGGHYQIVRVLGQGGFGIVYLVKDLHKLDELLVAKELFAKEFSFRQRESTTVINQSDMVHIFRKIKEDIKQEVTILSQITNQNIVKAYGYLEENDTIYSIMEYLQGMDLESYLKEHGAFSEEESQELLAQLIHGLKPIHEKNIIHRDIKPNNIIRTPDGTYKIIDFSSNKQYVDGKTTTITSYQNPTYTAPELMQKKTVIGEFSDVYSIGMTLIRTLSSDNAMPNITDRFIDDNEFQEKIDALWINDRFTAILKKMIILNYKERFQRLEDIETLLNSDSNSIQPTPTTNKKETKKSQTKKSVTKKETHSNKKKPLGFFSKFILLGIFSIIGYTLYPTLAHKVTNYFSSEKKSPTQATPVHTTPPKQEETPPKEPTPVVKKENPAKKPLPKKEETPLATEPTNICNEQNVKLFLNEFIAVSESNDLNHIISFYTPKVKRYFGLKNVSQQKVLSDKRRYLKRWPSRKFELVNFKILSHYIEDDIEYCNVQESTRWSVESKSRKKVGKSTSKLLLIGTPQEQFKVKSIYTLHNKILVDENKLKPKATPKPKEHGTTTSPVAVPPKVAPKRVNFPRHSEMIINGNQLMLMIKYPKRVKKNEKVIVNVKLVNIGASTQNSGGISISFPQLKWIKTKKLMSNFATFKTYSSKSKIYHRLTHKAFRPKYLLLESTKRAWRTNEEHSLSFEIIPNQNTHRLRLLIRGALNTNRISPLSGATDQQGYPARVITINLD